MKSQAFSWQGAQAVKLNGGGYEAIILPAFGANCISLIHLPSGSQLLRMPQTPEALCEGCNVFGLPLLFPPNRIQDGRFVFEGREYVFPINEPSRGNHLHGFLSQTAFAWNGEGCFSFEATQEEPYLTFPHAFSIRRNYKLNEKGLLHTISVTNLSRCSMPAGIGVHAALRADEHCSLRMQPVCRWPADPVRQLTTGQRLTDEPILAQLHNGTFNPVDQPVSALMECLPGSEVVLHTNAGSWHCEPDPAFRFFMLWNGGGNTGFICPEPQTWVTDAPNLPLPPGETGIRWLAPEETWTLHLRYHYTKE